MAYSANFSSGSDIDAELDYDFDEVIDFCKSSQTSSACQNIVSDLNDLVKKLEACQENFHSKGSGSDALHTIYDGFATAIGSSSGNDASSGSGVAQTNSYAASLFQTCYEEAYSDQQTVNSATK